MLVLLRVIPSVTSMTDRPGSCRNACSTRDSSQTSSSRCAQYATSMIHLDPAFGSKRRYSSVKFLLGPRAKAKPRSSSLSQHGLALSKSDSSLAEKTVGPTAAVHHVRTPASLSLIPTPSTALHSISSRPTSSDCYGRCVARSSLRRRWPSCFLARHCAAAKRNTVGCQGPPLLEILGGVDSDYN